MKHMQLLLLLFCIYLFACKKDLNTNASGAKPGNTEIKQRSYKSFTTDKQTLSTISKFIHDSIHDFKSLDSYLSQFLNDEFKNATTRQNATLRVEDDGNPGESDEIHSDSWSQYYNEPGDYYGDLENEFSHWNGLEYSLAVFEGVAYGTSVFQKRHNTIVINFPYAYRMSVDRGKYHYLMPGHGITATLTGPALGELEYTGAYAFNVADVDFFYDGQIEGFVNIREKRTRIVDDEFNITFKAGLKAEIIEIGTELEGGRKVTSVTNTVGDYTINLLLQLTTPVGAADVIEQWTFWGNQYPYPKPTYNMFINGINQGYQQN